jgi:hypothetical protein
MPRTVCRSTAFLVAVASLAALATLDAAPAQQALKKQGQGATQSQDQGATQSQSPRVGSGAPQRPTPNCRIEIVGNYPNCAPSNRARVRVCDQTGSGQTIEFQGCAN